MTPGDVLGIVLAHAGLVEALWGRHGIARIAIIRAIRAKDRATAKARVRVDQGQFSLHQIGHLRGGDGVRIDERVGDGKVGDDAASDVFQLGTLQLGVEIPSGLKAGSSQRLNIGLETLSLQVAQHLVKEQVVDVIDRVGSDKDG